MVKVFFAAGEDFRNEWDRATKVVAHLADLMSLCEVEILQLFNIPEETFCGQNVVEDKDHWEKL